MMNKGHGYDLISHVIFSFYLFFRSLQMLTKEFEKGGERRQSAKRIAESLKSDLKVFMKDSIPLMLLVCNPGMHERHWEEIESITGVAIPKGTSPTLAMMTEIGKLLHRT